MRGTGGDGFLTKKLVRRFVQTPFRTAGVCREVTDQFTREFVHVGSFEVIDLLSLEIEDGRAKDDRYVDATAVKYFSVHNGLPLRWPPPWAPRQIALTARSVASRRMGSEWCLAVPSHRPIDQFPRR